MGEIEKLINEVSPLNSWRFIYSDVSLTKIHPINEQSPAEIRTMTYSDFRVNYMEVFIPLDVTVYVTWATAVNQYYLRKVFEEDGDFIIRYKKIAFNSVENWGPKPSGPTLIRLDTFGSGVSIHFNIDENSLYKIVEKPIFEGVKPIVYQKKDFEALGLEDRETYLIEKESFETDLSNHDKEQEVQVHLNSESGIVGRYPYISKTIVGYNVEYVYSNDEFAKVSFISWQFLRRNWAIKLEFKSIYGFITYMNKTHIRDAGDFENGLSEKNTERGRLFNSYLEMLNEAYNDVKHNSHDLLKLFFFLPESINLHIDNSILWKIVAKGASISMANVFWRNEDAFLKVIKVLARTESSSNFLGYLHNIKVAARPNVGNKKEPLILALQYHLDGDNYRTFLYLFWSIWNESQYSNLDSDENKLIDPTGKSPVLMPYKSDKTLGFNHDNAAIGWNRLTKKVQVDIEFETYEIEKRKFPFFDFGSDPIFEYEVQTPVVKEETYQYHLYSPIVIINEGNPHFLFKAQGGEQKKYTVLPAFILYAREKSAVLGNVLTAAEYLLDVLSAVSGVGSLIRAGRLLNTLNAGKTLIFKAAVKVKGVGQAAVGAIEVSSGVGNGLLKLLDMKDSELGKAVSDVLLKLELLSLGIELTAAVRAGLKKSAQTALDTKQLKDAEKRANDIIELNLDKKGKLNRTESVKEAEETLEGIEFLENLVEEHQRFLKFGDELGAGAKFDYTTIPAIVKQIRKNKGYEKFECIIVDRNNQEYRKLFQAWQKSGGSAYGINVPIYANHYKGVPVKGPKVLFFVGEAVGTTPIEHVLKHTAQHEFWHVEMHIQLINKLGHGEKYKKLISDIPTHIKEEYVTHRFLKTRSKAMDAKEIDEEIRRINDMRDARGLNLLDRSYFKNKWDLRKELSKNYNIKF